MISEYENRSAHCNCSHQYYKCRDYTYTSCLEYFKKNGIIVNMPPPVTAKQAKHSGRERFAVTKQPAIPGNADVHVAPVRKEDQKVNMDQSCIEDMEDPGGKAPSERQDDRLMEEEGLHGRGLFYYRKWWERSEVDISVNGDMLTGIPIFTDKNTLRVVNDNYSYFIPLEKVDYIRTTDGLKSCSNRNMGSP